MKNPDTMETFYGWYSQTAAKCSRYKIYETPAGTFVKVTEVTTDIFGKPLNFKDSVPVGEINKDASPHMLFAKGLGEVDALFNPCTYLGLNYKHVLQFWSYWTHLTDAQKDCCLSLYKHDPRYMKHLTFKVKHNINDRTPWGLFALTSLLNQSERQGEAFTFFTMGLALNDHKVLDVLTTVFPYFHYDSHKLVNIPNQVPWYKSILVPFLHQRSCGAP